MNEKVRKQSGFILKALPLLFSILQILPLHLEGALPVLRKWDTPGDPELMEWYDRNGNWRDRVEESMAVDFDCPGIGWTNDGPNLCELFWHLDSTRRAKLWDGVNNNERREILGQLNTAERLQLFRVLSDEGLRMLLGPLEVDDFKDIWKHLSEAERVRWFLCLDDKNRVCLIARLNANEILSLVRYNVGSDRFVPLIRMLNDEQRLKVINRAQEGNCNVLRSLWSMLTDDERQQAMSNSKAYERKNLFVGLKDAENRNGNGAIHGQIVRFLGTEQCIELFFSLSLSGECDNGRVLLWKCLDPKTRRIVWDITNIVAETKREGSEQLRSYLEKVKLPISVVSDENFRSDNRMYFLWHLDCIGYKLLKNILSVEELIQLWSKLGGSVPRVLLWCNLTDEEREQLRQNPSVQEEGPSWLISGEGGIVQWYRALEDDRDKRKLCLKLDEESVTRLWYGLNHGERSHLVCGLANSVLDESLELSRQLWVNRMNNFEQASVWGDIQTKYRAKFWIALRQTNQADALSYLRQDEYGMVDRLRLYIEYQGEPYLLFKNWTILKPEDRVKSFWLLWSGEREEAWNMLEPWAWKYCYKHLSTPLKSKYWNSLSSEAKRWNIWYLSEEQREKLCIVSSEETKSPAFLASEISIDRKRFAQLSAQEQEDFYARVAASVYSE